MRNSWALASQPALRAAASGASALYRMSCTTCRTVEGVAESWQTDGRTEREKEKRAISRKLEGRAGKALPRAQNHLTQTRPSKSAITAAGPITSNTTSSYPPPSPPGVLQCRGGGGESERRETATVGSPVLVTTGRPTRLWSIWFSSCRSRATLGLSKMLNYLPHPWQLRRTQPTPTPAPSPPPHAGVPC